MSVYEVTRRFSFCYGHRLMNYDGKCRFPHGHNAEVSVTVTSAALDERGFVVDFGVLRDDIGDWIDRDLDHRMLLRHDDPLVKALRDLNEPVFVMQENPTAENIAKLVFEFAQSIGFTVVEVTLWETSTSCAIYRA